MEHLTQRRSQFELSHTLMTPPEACHHGCYPTQWAHSLRPCILERKTFHQQKILFNNFTKQLMFVTCTFCQSLPSCPTYTWLTSVFGCSIPEKLLKISITTALPASLCEIVFTWHYWNNHRTLFFFYWRMEANSCFGTNDPSSEQPWSTSVMW